ncbi:proprotein convertase subtilisin/kexin type 6-like isoform X2 [Lineus longissimus]|uniref:proprotein convertase subtilisin/kexin type 6-like isoform X2 n=1 Tax=Lineus longissimus TaxID=88925 RepID=UPI002B4D718C
MVQSWRGILTQGLLILNLILGSFADVFLNQWAVEVPGGHGAADALANELGFINKGQIGSIENHYEFLHHGIEKRSTSSSHHHHQALVTHPQITWAEQQVAKKRVKRDFRPKGPPISFKDPLYPSQWYLLFGAKGGFDMNVVPAWQRGYTGQGVVVTILDDGLETNHDDLKKNYDPRASFDINSEDGDPMPRYDSGDENRHGTRCAGEVAAQANNSKCGVGIAYNARIGGVRMLDGDVSDIVEARSLSLQPDYIDIYSASWGPDDNGMVVDGPAKLAKQAFLDGVTKGRNNKGSIFVWASGNGGSSHDSCNCDGYTNSIYTLSISSVSEMNKEPWYLEECSSTLASTYSSGDTYKEKQIVTTDLHNGCTESHTGTSASAPLAAAICALALEANPDMTWRDMQYITLMTARPQPMAADPNWVTNGLGRKVSLKYGYGLMDADAMVRMAEVWTPVPEQHMCETSKDGDYKAIEGRGIEVTVTTTGCLGDHKHTIRHLEHVQVRASISYDHRGDLILHLVSPNGTRSTLLPKRPSDYKSDKFEDWPFMSVHFWGESPVGEWKFVVENGGPATNTGSLVSWQLIMYGTAEQPVRVKRRKATTEPPKNGQQNHGRGSSQQPLSTKAQTSDVTRTTSSYYDPDYSYNYEQAGPEQPGEVCDPQCRSGCVGPKPEDCQECLHYRRGQHGPCVLSCHSGEYADETNVCHKCHSTCSTCEQKGPEGCLTCQQGYFLVQDQQVCVAQCPDGYYADQADGLCFPCDDNCVTCSSEGDVCTACSEGMTLRNHKCLLECKPNQYKDQTGICQMCHISCDSCSGPSMYDCVRCPGGVFFKNGTCIHECGLFFYADTQLWECNSCDPSCLRCLGPQANQCTRCSDDFRLVNNGCTNKDVACDEDEFKTKDGYCKKCHQTCKTCSGESDGDCISCTSERIFYENQCVTKCRAGYYTYVASAIDASTTKECRECHRNCRLCKGGGAKDCTACEHGMVLVNGECSTTCPEGQFKDQSNKCTSCDASCLECTGPGMGDCIKCPMPVLLYNGRCQSSSCPTGYYMSHGECGRCHHTCKTCTDGGPSNCLTCEEGYIVYRGFCMKAPTCAVGSFFNVAKRECQLCNKTCRTCRGPGPTNCTSCEKPYIQNKQNSECTLCCSETHRKDCCTCHLETGICVDDRNIERPGSDTNSFKDSGGLSFQHVTLSSVAASTFGLVTLATLSCIFIVVLFFVTFGLLQAYTNGNLCFTQKVAYQKLPTVYDHKTDRILLNREDFEDEDEEDLYSVKSSPNHTEELSSNNHHRDDSRNHNNKRNGNHLGANHVDLSENSYSDDVTNHIK